MTNTTRLGLTYPPVAGTTTADVTTDMQVFLNQLDALVMAYSSGTFAGRPAASALAGKIYWATDYKRSYFSDGTTWYDVQPPVGQIIGFPSVTPPDATWLLCNGQAVSRTTYAALFGLLGSVYGAGNGSTTFNVPDLRGRTWFGADQGAGRVTVAGSTVAATGGEERHTLTIAEMPAHHHAFTAAFENVSTQSPGGASWNVPTNAASNTGDTGGGGTHNVMPPFQVGAWMIKT